MRRGLVLGKFAPFHRGHEHLVSTAACRVEELVVVVYETAWYGIPAETRAGWIRALHPEVTVVVLPDLDPTTYHEQTEASAHAAQIEAELGGFTDVFTSEEYGDRLASALHARHTCVDRRRARHHVSGTMIRSDPFAHRASVDPVVYRSLVRRVVFLGAESTGKTTLARELAPRHATVWVPEYGRERWEAQGGKLDFDDLEDIAREQLRRERTVGLDANRLLFCDTNVVTTEQWSRRLFGRASDMVVRLAAETAADYTTFLCEPDFGWEQDGTRETADAQTQFQRAIRADLDRRGLRYTSLVGDVAARIGAVERALGTTT